MNRSWVSRAALVLGAVGAVACSSSGSNQASIEDAGSDAADGPAVEDANGFPEAGPHGTTSEAGDAANQVTDAGDANDVGAADAGDGGGPTYAIFVGTDFTNAELSVVNLSPNALAGNLALGDEDSVAYASGGLGFVLERSVGSVLSLSPTQPWTARATIDVNDNPDAGSYESNPHAVVVTAGTKAYVVRYASNVVKIVDVASGASTGSIDLSAFVASDDPDGLVDVNDGVYDPAAQRAYLLLQRINQYDYGMAPDYVGACLASHAEIVAVDVATDTVVPLNDAGTNGAIDLLGDNPQGLTADFANGRILVADAGCYAYPDGGTDGGASIRLGRGIESVTLATAMPAWLYQTGDLDLLSSLILADATHGYVELGGQWFPWNPTQTTLGSSSPIANFPLAPFYDGNGRVVGLSAVQPDAGSDAGTSWSVVAMSVAGGDVSTLVPSPFKYVSPDPSYGVTAALLR